MAADLSFDIDGTGTITAINDGVLTLNVRESFVRLHAPDVAGQCAVGVDVQFRGSASVDDAGVYSCSMVYIERRATYSRHCARAALSGRVVDVRPSKQAPVTRVSLVFRIPTRPGGWRELLVEYPKSDLPDEPVNQLVALHDMQLMDGCIDFNFYSYAHWRGQEKMPADDRCGVGDNVIQFSARKPTDSMRNLEF